jgi:deoxyhypusine synthase
VPRAALHGACTQSARRFAHSAQRSRSAALSASARIYAIEYAIEYAIARAQGDFALKGAELRVKGINRIGNLLVPNRNYCLFEDWFSPILDAMLDEQLAQPGTYWSPCSMIHRMGREIANEDSICYWAWKNDIPIFCPAITDGSIGDMIYFHSFKRPGLVVDIAQDIRKLNNLALKVRPLPARAPPPVPAPVPVPVPRSHAGGGGGSARSRRRRARRAC